MTGPAEVPHPPRDETPDGETVPWRALLAESRDRLAAAGLDAPDHDARRILEEASGLVGAELVVGLDDPATVGGVRRIDAMVARRAAGEPLQYVLGSWGFRSLDLMVDRRALIPRPETEVVVGLALDELARRRAEGHRGSGGELVAVDVGVGTGAIALSLVVEQPRCSVVGVELAEDALDVARANLAGIGRAATRVRLVRGDRFEGVPAELAGQVDLVVSNPPYLAEAEPIDPAVADWEPRGALVAGPLGTEVLDALVDEARAWLAPGGSLVLELAPAQAPALADRARSLGYVDVAVHPDLAGLDRALVARRPDAAGIR